MILLLDLEGYSGVGREQECLEERKSPTDAAIPSSAQHSKQFFPAAENSGPSRSNVLEKEGAGTWHPM